MYLKVAQVKNHKEVLHPPKINIDSIALWTMRTSLCLVLLLLAYGDIFFIVCSNCPKYFAFMYYVHAKLCALVITEKDHKVKMQLGLFF